MMNVVSLTAIEGTDPELIHALVEADLPTEDLLDADRHFFRATEPGGQTVGFAGVERCQGSRLLRSVVVLPAYRGSGLGRALVESTLNTLGKDGDVFLATTSAASFFKRAGFVEVSRDMVPAPVLATRQLSSICPSSATIMRLDRPPI
ncbi:arsenic resistance N-acetyltransferase ArsN2 [Rhizobium sp.]|uniref:arsenic resistance N-acetyltransferase ArsN2 n=1 Tax=Rhizobium sp. TaxID=391 RepID=UPI0028B242B0